MIDREKLLDLLRNMTLQHAYDTTDTIGRSCKDVWLNIHMTTADYEEFRKLFDDDSKG